ncbi:MAG: pectate lyase [Planctomycetaceae bacterium]|nr:pectate lyase [Planctomycetaceae bacterium]
MLELKRVKGMGRLWLFIVVCACGMLSYARAPWNYYLNKPDDWFKSDKGKQILENILTWQDDNGVWPKNEDTDIMAFTADRKELRGTFDNEATTGEMRMLARGYTVLGDERYKTAFLKGLDLILKAQYPNGGWPQYYPLRKGYYTRITFNDQCMVRLMNMMDEVAKSDTYSFVDAKRRADAKAAFDKGVDCVLKCQIRVNGKLKVWCAQHDEVDFSPRPARSYELASLSGGESAGILRLLMSLDNPSPQVVQAIQAGVAWYKQSEIHGLAIRWVDGKLTAVPDPNGKPLWGRFCEIETDRAFFCDRDGIPKYDYNLIDQERSTGYAWYGRWGDDVYKDYEKWQRRWGHLLVSPGAKVLMIIGDSTVCEYPESDRRAGWGQFIQGYFTDDVKVLNHAKSGRSTKTFLNQGLWTKALATKPAWVLIQFGHNDSHDLSKPEATNAATDFADNLRKYIADSRAAGAEPILITPMYRRKFEANGTLEENLKPYAEAMKKVAVELKVPIVDLHTASGELYLKLGPEKTAELANAPEDRTHFNRKGAEMMAELVMQQLPGAVPSLKANLKKASDKSI